MAFIKNSSLLSSSTFCYVITLFSLFMASYSSFLNDTESFKLSTPTGGQWVLLHPSIGISAMHMQLLNNDKVVLFDRTDMGLSNLSLPSGSTCRKYAAGPRNKTITDCTSHSLLYDVASNTFRPLVVKSDTWCSSGSVDPTGTLIQTGGYGPGIRKIRKFATCDDSTCDWAEMPFNLLDRRWYSTNQILPDGRVIVVGGRRSFSYEFYPKQNDLSSKSFYMRFLWETTDPYEENNLYPFLHLLPDGNLFVFANNRAILFDYNHNQVLKEFPGLPDGGIKRNYPSTGSSVLLPLKMNGVTDELGLPEAEVLVCGGSPPGAYNMSNLRRVFVGASNSCGRIKVTDPNPKWVMESMPIPRVMGDMLVLPTGDVIILNGASNGTAGWEDAINPVFNPVLYKTYESDPERRFVVLNPSSTPRMYHSSAILLADGRILVGGSNPHQVYDFRAKRFPTDLSLEAYYPPYLGPPTASLRPSILAIESRDKIVFYGQMFSVTFVLSMYRPDPGITVALVTPSFSTHSFAMNQRMVVLDATKLEHLSTFAYKITAYGPPKDTVAPPGYYMLFIVHAGVPSQAVWVKVQQ